MRDRPRRTLAHAKWIRAMMSTVCGDPMQWVLAWVGAPWWTWQRHRPQQTPRQLHLSQSNHCVVFVRRTDERWSRKAARQRSTSGTRWPWRSRPNRRATGADAGHAAYRLGAVAVLGRRQAALALPDVACFVRPLLGFGSVTDPSRACGRRRAHDPRRHTTAPSAARSLAAALPESIASARRRRPSGSLPMEVDGWPAWRRAASDPELAMTGARGGAADTMVRDADCRLNVRNYINCCILIC